MDKDVLTDVVVVVLVVVLVVVVMDGNTTRVYVTGFINIEVLLYADTDSRYDPGDNEDGTVKVNCPLELVINWYPDIIEPFGYNNSILTTAFGVGIAVVLPAGVPITVPVKVWPGETVDGMLSETEYIVGKANALDGGTKWK